PGPDSVRSCTAHGGAGSPDTYSTAGDKTHTYADGPNSYTITVDLTDEDGTFTNASSLAVTVDNVAPTIALSGASHVNEGSPYTQTGGAARTPGRDTATSQP